MNEIILAGGCFWGTEHYLRQIPGVTHTTVGYAGGAVDSATYEQVCTGATGHAEAVQVIWDEDEVDLDAILQVFFQIHDPTTPNRQGNDIGSQYRSAIFYKHPTHADIAHARIDKMQQSQKWRADIVTQVVPYTTYVVAEPYHQQYLTKNPDGYNCHFPRTDWVVP